jgi:endonuclease/exonuclease/phosphatase (EEP) superfamily protein YafD
LVASSGRRQPSRARILPLAVYAYATLVALLWLAVAFLVDRTWPATLIGFGPRWLAAVPALPLAVWAITAALRDRLWRPLGVLVITVGVVLFGVMDFRLGIGRASGVAEIRVMTQNLGAGRVTAEALDRLMRRERIDVAALQECPFYDNGPMRFGWQFYYGGNLCVVSRFPFTVLDQADPPSAWRRGPHSAMRFEVEAPGRRFQLLNVHFATIRDGVAAVRSAGWGGLAEFDSNRRLAARESQRARERIASVHAPVIVAGDFNLPIESATYQDDWADLSNAFSICGRGLGHTKFTRFFGVRIDHVLTTGAWECTDARVLASPYRGDHRPLVADLRLR